MSSAAQESSQFTTQLTSAEREWIRRRGRSARALEAEQRRMRAELVAKEMRRREQLIVGQHRFPR